jgi:hypothetical protein
MRFATIFISLLPSLAATIQPDPGGLTVHEWGTFTSVANQDGRSMWWQPLDAVSDLPCFVYRLGQRNIKVSGALVRMETPVLYFYSRSPVTASVHVDFPQGVVTEWYPKASRIDPDTFKRSGDGHVEWNGIQVTPGATPELPIEAGPNRYYAARATDAAPIRIGDQNEKLIFYRGLGSFSIPVKPRFTGSGYDQIEIKVDIGDPIPQAILFENRGGRIGYRVLGQLSSRAAFTLPALNGDLAGLRHELESMLTARGLYAKEAHAMVETWRDSWFEEGTRVLYIVPRSMADSVLPLTVTPAPSRIERVFVGRVEVLSPAMKDEIQAAVAASDIPTLKKYGRFLGPFLAQISAGRLPEDVNDFLSRAYRRVQEKLDYAGGCSASSQPVH